MLSHTLAPFLAEPRIVQIVVVLDSETAAAPPAWLTTLDARVSRVTGGAERGDSVRAGLEIVQEDVDVVLVHDAARPLVSRRLIVRTMEAAALGACVVAALPVTDTIQEVDAERRVVATPDRRRLWMAQTPQAFPRTVLVEAYAWAASQGITATDDAALVVRFGEAVRVLEGESGNIKITTETDLAYAEYLLARG